MEKNERTCKTSSGPLIAPSALATATALLQLADEPGDGQIVAKTRTRTLRAKYTCNPLPDEAVVRLIAIVSTTQLSSTGKIPWTNIQREHFPTYTRHALRGMYRRSLDRIQKHKSSWISKQTSLLIQHQQSMGSTTRSTNNTDVVVIVKARAKQSGTQRSVQDHNRQ